MQLRPNAISWRWLSTALKLFMRRRQHRRSRSPAGVPGASMRISASFYHGSWRDSGAPDQPVNGFSM
jgi:hypothetical protein